MKCYHSNSKRQQHSNYLLEFVLIMCSCVILSSCALGEWVGYKMSRSYIKSISDIKYEDISDMKKAFRTDGYYAQEERDRSTAKGHEYIMIFYNDGTYSFHYINSPVEPKDSIDIGNYIIPSDAIFNNGEYFGMYRIDSDTVYVNKYRRDLFAGLEMRKNKFHIIDNETLVLCYDEDPQLVYKNETAKWDRNVKYVFKPAILPKPRDKFVKKKKWMWKKESDWERYMHK